MMSRVVQIIKYSHFNVDLKGRVACFPTYEGAAFSSVIETMQKLKLTPDNCTNSLRDFFDRKSCLGNRKSKYCRSEYLDDSGALNCLNNYGEVAFMNLETFKNLTGMTHHFQSH